MIRLTRETDYAIVLLVRLASQPESGPAPGSASQNARELAEACRLRPPMVGKILKTLARGGILASQRGAKGGYSLARPAERITVAEVVTAMEGPIALTECTSDEEGCCDNESFCGVRGNWQLINHAVRQALDGLTLAEMTRPITRPSLLNLTIRKPAAVRCEPALETP